MFGYVRLHKPTITMGEYEQYRGIYCTLCKRLGRRYGVLSRFTLSYDMTFLALLEMALTEAGPNFTPSRCSFNPTKRCLKAQHTAPIDRAADVGTLLTYYKLKDTLADEGLAKRLGALAALPFAAAARRRAQKRCPDTDRAVAQMMTRQTAVEADGCTSIDRAAEPFALLLQTLAASTAADDKQRQILERFGYCLGRWVYLMDAVDDLAQDLQQGRYNPYIGARQLTPDHPEAVQETRRYARQTLNACLAECIAAYNLLDICRFDGILRNILEQGMPHAQERVISGEEKTDERSL
ncbi:MAG: hypothetical protein IKU51_01605 [Clostridia bacterium]|nr:hypothetical protein [Clostridia bacterium]